MLLAHDQTWNGDDWLTIAVVPPLVFVLSVAGVVLVAAILDRDKKDALYFSAAFLGFACGGAWIILWILAGVMWLGGWL
jgi:hypothetical protein